MAPQIEINPPAPIQLGNLTTFRIRFVDEDGAAVDISTASPLVIKLEDPAGAAIAITAAFETDGSDGWIVATYSPLAFGDYRIQGRATIAGSDKHTGRGIFPVEPNLP